MHSKSEQVSISSTFYVPIICTNIVSAAFSSYILALVKNLYKKWARIMLMKLTPGLNFINVLLTAFTLADPKSVKKIDNLTVFFTLLGSACVKAVHRTLMKLSLVPVWLVPFLLLLYHVWEIKIILPKQNIKYPSRQDTVMSCTCFKDRAVCVVVVGTTSYKQYFDK